MHQPNEMCALSRRGGGGVDVGLGPLWPPAVARHACLHILAAPFPDGWPQGPIHFKEDVLRVKRSRFTRVILSGAKDLSPDRDPSLRSEPAPLEKRRDDKARWSCL